MQVPFHIWDEPTPAIKNLGFSLGLHGHENGCVRREMTLRNEKGSQSLWNGPTHISKGLSQIYLSAIIDHPSLEMSLVLNKWYHRPEVGPLSIKNDPSRSELAPLNHKKGIP